MRVSVLTAGFTLINARSFSIDRSHAKSFRFALIRLVRRLSGWTSFTVVLTIEYGMRTWYGIDLSDVFLYLLHSRRLWK